MFLVEGFAISSEVILTLFTLNYNHGIVADCYLNMNILVQQPYMLLNKLDLTKHIITQVHMHTATIIINRCDISYAYFRYIQSNMERMEVHLRVGWFNPGVHILSKNFEATSKF